MQFDIKKDLLRIVEASYKCFSYYKLRSTSLEVCKCNVCMSDEVEQELINTPLRSLSAQVLCEFTNSAHGEGTPDEIKYFLPRYFELLANGEETSYLGTWTSLGRLSYGIQWKEKWPQDEVNVIEAFLDSLLWESTDPQSKAHQLWDEILVMLASVGHDPCKVLRLLLHEGNKNQIYTVLSLYCEISDNTFSSNYWNDFKETSSAIVSLLRSDLSLEAGFRALENPEYEHLNAGIEAALDFLSVRSL